MMITHGTVVSLETDADVAVESKSWPFWYMFEDLQKDPEARLKTSEQTVNDLRRLGERMIEETADPKTAVNVPAIYTFFGQFVDHDITLEMGSSKNSLANPSPIPLDQIPGQIVNSRSPKLDLDNVYGPDLDGNSIPREADEARLRLDLVKGIYASGTEVPNDLPRRPNGSAFIGDPRDDENIVTAQLHVAFMRAHNVLVEREGTYEAASRQLRQHYQWIVLNDLLKRIADPLIVKNVKTRPAKFFKYKPGPFFMPLEFSVAAYRFGHSKVRAAYDMFNDINEGGDLGLLFSRARQPLTKSWVIDWTHFVKPELGFNHPRPIDTTLTELLLELLPKQLIDKDKERNLATRNLLRGYILNLPTGQAVAKAMASDGIVPMTDEEMKSVTQEHDQYKLLKDTGFLTSTPLWFYILAEAKFYSRGYHLGPVGSTIVAEVLIEVLRNSTDSILSEDDWRPTLGETPGKFDLDDLLKFAGVF